MGGPFNGLLEGEVEGGELVGTSLGTSSPSAPVDKVSYASSGTAQQIFKPDRAAPKATSRAGTKPDTALGTRLTNLVVCRPAVGVGQHLISL